jgi:hypothetical protein
MGLACHIAKIHSEVLHIQTFILLLTYIFIKIFETILQSSVSKNAREIKEIMEILVSKILKLFVLIAGKH